MLHRTVCGLVKGPEVRPGRAEACTQPVEAVEQAATLGEDAVPVKDVGMAAVADTRPAHQENAALGVVGESAAGSGSTQLGHQDVAHTEARRCWRRAGQGEDAVRDKVNLRPERADGLGKLDAGAGSVVEVCCTAGEATVLAEVAGSGTAQHCRVGVGTVGIEEEVVRAVVRNLAGAMPMVGVVVSS